MPPNEQPAPTCTYTFNGIPCQLTAQGEPLHTFNNKPYCALHLPLTSPEKSSVNFDGYLKQQLSGGRAEIDGAQFRGAPASLAPGNVNLTLRDCTFADGAQITTNDAGATFESCNFLGGVTFLLGGGTIKVRARFPGPVTVHVYRGNVKRVDFSRCYFSKGIEVNGQSFRRTMGAWEFRRATFGGPLAMSNVDDGISQATSFEGSRFKAAACPPEHEAHYRGLRLEFEKHSDRESEGVFYALEKRCARYALPKASIARWVSGGYDLVSEYGQSYERALLWFAGIQVGMLTLYGAMSKSIHFGALFDGPRLRQLIAFTLAQSAKPFELLANRKPEGVATIMGDSWSAGWALVTFLHSIVSLATLALLILALRWRFRRA